MVTSLKYLFICILLLLLGFTFFLYTPAKPQTKNILTSPSPYPTSPIGQTITYQDQTYAYAFGLADPITRVILITNFSEKKTAKELARTFECKIAINGSYYDTQGNPLGGFTTQRKTLKKSIASRLMDGHISINGSKAIISFQPQQDASIILQSGPLLLINGGVTSLRIGEDEKARRSVMATTKSGTVVFMTIYDPESVYQGPFLADLPDIVQNISASANLSLIDAINLDGGMASAFFNNEITLSELSPIGSLFCLQ